MNIFHVSPDPMICAISLGDKHCVKMALETAQMLSTAHRLAGSDKAWCDQVGLYKASHANHPMNQWVRGSRGAYSWTCELFRVLLSEFRHRRGRDHASGKLLPVLKENTPADISEFVWDSIPQCMPDEFRGPDTHEAYRRYYAEKWRQGIVEYQWGREMPQWLVQQVQREH